MRDNVIDAYISEIISEIYRVESLKSSKAKMDPVLLALWIEEINQACENMYEQYLMGFREHFYMSIEEYEQIFDEAGMKYSDILLNDLVDSDKVTALINKNGDIVYKNNSL